MPELTIPEKILPIAQNDKRFKILIGGRGSGKSQSVADLLIARVDTQGDNVVCGREFQNSIDDSVHSVVSEEIKRLGVGGFDVQATRINHRNGGGFTYKGLRRNPESIKSMHGTNIFWVEEAQTLSEESINILTPTIREEGSEIWMTANPRYADDPFSERFLKPWEAKLRSDGIYEDDLHLVIFLNYMDNPWFPDELEQERQFDYENKSRAKYNHIWLGHYDDTVEDAIIAPEWFDAAVDAHKKLGIEPKGVEVVAHDPSDTGPDAKGLVHRHGILVTDAQFREFGDVNQGCDWALDYALDQHADQFIWDGDGMGVSLRRQVGDALNGKNMMAVMFQGSAGVDNPGEIYEDISASQQSKTNKETFRNKRAQYYWYLRDLFRNTYQAVAEGKYINPSSLIAISSEIEDLDVLRSEVCRIPLKRNVQGLIQIQTKEEMRRNDIPSPNMADSLMMSLAAQMPEFTKNRKARPVKQPKMGGWT